MLDYNKGVDSIYRLDDEILFRALTMLGEQDRFLPVPELIKRKMFYIPDADYLVDYFGEDVLNPAYGMYDKYERCRVCYKIAIPIFDFHNDIVSLCFYDNGGRCTTDEERNSRIKYMYQSYNVFKKDRYFYGLIEDYTNALRDDYIIIVDGTFDQVRLSSLGYNAISLMSSNFTAYHKEYLKTIKHIIVIPDNDSAGVDLYNKIRNERRDTISISQHDFKDIDDFLKLEENIRIFDSAFKSLQSIDFRLSLDISKGVKQDNGRNISFLQRTKVSKMQKIKLGRILQ